MSVKHQKGDMLEVTVYKGTSLQLLLGKKESVTWQLSQIDNNISLIGKQRTHYVSLKPSLWYIKKFQCKIHFFFFSFFLIWNKIYKTKNFRSLKIISNTYFTYRMPLLYLPPKWISFPDSFQSSLLQCEHMPIKRKDILEYTFFVLSSTFTK